jgi:hypothetical protein
MGNKVDAGTARLTARLRLAVKRVSPTAIKWHRFWRVSAELGHVSD